MIKIENISFKRENKTIFNNYSFEITKGDIVAILGPNGRGKTTLLKTMLNLLPINEGKITNDNAQIAYVPQSSQLIFDFIVLEVVLMGRAKHLKLFSSPSKNDYNLAHESLEMLNIKEFAYRNFSELSGGEKQLVLIARAIVSKCNFLILDEPASALDFSNQKKVLTKLKELNSQQNITIVYTTHYPQHAFHLSTKVLLMFQDNYLYDETEKIMTEEILSELYNIKIKQINFEVEEEKIKTIFPVF